MTRNEKEIWQRFARTRSAEDRERLVQLYLPRVGGIVGRIVERRRMRGVTDELLSAGALGLVQAVDTFDASRGSSFSTWLWHKVRSCVLEECRLQGRWMSRAPRRHRPVPKALSDDRAAPDTALEGLDWDEATWRMLWEVINPRERRVLWMTFIGHRSTAEIAAAMGVTEGRVSQLRTRALRRLRKLYEEQGRGER